MTTYYDPTAGFHAFALQARTDNVGAAVDDADGQDLRAIFAAMPAGIVSPKAGFKVAADTNLDLAVGSGTAHTDTALIDGDDPGQGKYLLRLGDDETTVTLDAADLSNPRIDQIWAVVLDDQYDSSGLVLGRLAVTKGTPAASPSPPGADGSWKASLLLASVLVGAGVTVITDADITDERALTYLELAGGSTVPPGVIMDFGGTDTPTGWLYCNGGAISRADYAALFAAIGTIWGVGDGSTTFNKPDLRGRIRIGQEGTPGLAVGASSGTWDHTHTGPSHTHARGTLAVPNHAQHRHARGSLAVPDHAQHDHTFYDTFTTGSPSSHTPADDSPAMISVATYTHTHSGTVSGTTSADGPTSHGTITGETALDGPTSHGAITGATAAEGTGSTGPANPPVAAVRTIIKY